MLKVYFLIFWIPAATSAVTLLAMWTSGMLLRPTLFLSWFLAALLLQFGAALLSPAWAIGLVLQTALAISLAIKWKPGS